MAAVSIGELEATLRLRDELTSALKVAHGQLKDTSASMRKMGDDLHAAGAAMIPFSAAIVGAAAAAFKFGKDFETNMKKVMTIGGATEAQMDSFRGSILDLAPAVGIGPGALSAALIKIPLTALTAEEALDVLKVSAKASAVGMGDAAEMGKLLTAVISAYGSESMSAEHAADVMFNTILQGNVETNELAGTLGRVVGIAAQTGTTFEEVGGFIATFTRLGVDASEAVVALRGIMATLLKPSQQAREALQAAGSSIDELRMAVRDKGLNQAMIDLVDQFKGNEDAIATIVPNIRALAGILGTAGVQSESLGEIMAEMGNSTGVLDKAFEATADTIDFKLNVALADAQAAAIALFEAFKSEAGVFTAGLGRMASAAKAFALGISEWDPIARGAFLVVSGVVAALGPGLIALGLTVKGLAVAFGLGKVGADALAAAFGRLTISAATTNTFLAGNMVAGMASASSAASAMAITIRNMGATAVVTKGSFLGLTATVNGLKAALAIFAASATGIIGIVAAIGAALDRLTRGMADLPPGLKHIQDELDRTKNKVQDLGNADDSIKQLRDQISGVGLIKDMAELTAVTRDLAAAGELPTSAMKRIAQAAVVLREQGQKLSPELENIVTWFERVEEVIPPTVKSTGGLGKALADAQREVDSLSGSVKNQLVQAIRSGAFSMEVLEKETGLSSTALKLFNDQLDKSDQDMRKLKEEQKQSAQAMMEMGWAARDAEQTMRLLGNTGVQSSTMIVDGLGKALLKMHSLTASVKDLDAVMSSKESLAAFFDMAKVVEAPNMDDFKNSFAGNLTEALKDIPDIMMKAFTGNGGIIGAMKAIGTQIAEAWMKPTEKGMSVMKKAAIVTGAVVGAGAIAAGERWTTAFGQVGLAAAGVATSAALATGATLGTVAAAGALTLGVGAAAVGVALLAKKFLTIPKAVKEARVEQEKFLNDLRKIGFAGTNFQVLHQAGVQAMTAIGKSGEEARLVIEALMDTDNPARFAEAMGQVQRALDLQAAAQETLVDTLGRYKFTIEELGPALQKQQLSEQAQQLFKDWEVLTQAGIDITAVGREMKDSINDFVQAALRTKTEVDPAMRPMLERMAEMGELVDANGVKITDLEGHGITFAMTMSEGFKTIVDSVKELTDVMRRGLGLAVDDVTKKINDMPRNVRVGVEFDAGDMPRVPAVSRHQGGMVPWTRAHSGLAVGDVPIIAQSGEGILSRRTVARIGGAASVDSMNAGGSGSSDIGALEASLSAIERLLEAQAAMLPRSMKAALARVG